MLSAFDVPVPRIMAISMGPAKRPMMPVSCVTGLAEAVSAMAAISAPSASIHTAEMKPARKVRLKTRPGEVAVGR